MNTQTRQAVAARSPATRRIRFLPTRRIAAKSSQTSKTHLGCKRSGSNQVRCGPNETNNPGCRSNGQPPPRLPGSCFFAGSMHGAKKSAQGSFLCNLCSAHARASNCLDSKAFRYNNAHWRNGTDCRRAKKRSQSASHTMKASPLALLFASVFGGFAATQTNSSSDLAGEMETNQGAYFDTDWFQETDTNLVVSSAWSDPVQINYIPIRARMLIYEGYPPDVGGSMVKVYVELQNIARTVDRKARIYFDINKALRWEILDVTAKPVPRARRAGGSWGGPMPTPTWLTLPPDCTVRLRSSLIPGRRDKYGLSLAIGGLLGPRWDFPPNDTNEYFISATVVIDPPTNSLSAGITTDASVWEGTLTIPKVKLKVSRP
jgi:hypothetical protein